MMSQRNYLVRNGFPAAVSAAMQFDRRVELCMDRLTRILINEPDEAERAYVQGMIDAMSELPNKRVKFFDMLESVNQQLKDWHEGEPDDPYDQLTKRYLEGCRAGIGKMISLYTAQSKEVTQLVLIVLAADEASAETLRTVFALSKKVQMQPLQETLDPDQSYYTVIEDSDALIPLLSAQSEAHEYLIFTVGTDKKASPRIRNTEEFLALYQNPVFFFRVNESLLQEPDRFLEKMLLEICFR